MASRQNPFSVEASNDPNYLGFTKDISAPGPNTAYGTLFEGIGKLAASGAGAADTMIAQSAKDDTRKIVQDRIQRPYGEISPPEAASLALGAQVKKSGVAPTVAGDDTDPDGQADTSGFNLPTGETTPTSGSLFQQTTDKIQREVPAQVQAEVDQEITQLDRVRQGRAAGMISPTYLYTQYVAAAKSLYSKYPGYEDVIDNEFHKLTGVTPANAQISAIWGNFSALEKAQNSGQNKWDTEVRQMGKSAGLSGAVVNAGLAAFGDPAKMAKWREQAYDVNAEDVGVKRANTTLDNESKRGTLDQKRQQELLLQGGAGIIGKTFKETLLSGGVTVDQLQSRIYQYTQKGTVPPEELNQIKADAQKIYTNFSNALDDHFRGSEFNNVPPEYKIAAKTQLMAPITNFTESITKGGHKDFAIAAADLASIESMSSRSGNILIQNPANQMFAGMTKIFPGLSGGEIATIYLKLLAGQFKDEKGNPLSAIDKRDQDNVREFLLNGVHGRGSFDRATQPKDDGSTASPKALKMGIEGQNQIIQNPNIDPKIKTNVIKDRSSPAITNFLNSIKVGEQERAFSVLNAPAVTDEAWKLGQATPATWTAYKAQALRSLDASVKDSQGMVSQLIMLPELQARWDEKTNQIVFNDTTGVPGVQNIHNLNLAFRSMQHILSKDGETVSEKVLPYLPALGILQAPAPLEPGGPKTEPKAKSGKRSEGGPQKAQDAIQQATGTPAPGTGNNAPLAFSEAPGGTAKSALAYAKLKQGSPEDISAFLTPGKSSQHVDNLNPDFRGRLASLFKSAPEEIQKGIKIYSGYRTPQRQAELFQAAVEKYGSPEAARRYVAPPGNSPHNEGIAADLRYASPAVEKWVHANASKVGLHFRMAHEGWHIEPIPGWSNKK